MLIHKIIIIIAFTIVMTLVEQVVNNMYKLLNSQKYYYLQYNKGKEITRRECVKLFNCKYVIKIDSYKFVKKTFDKGYVISKEEVIPTWKAILDNKVYIDLNTMMVGVRAGKDRIIFKNIFIITGNNIRTIMVSSPIYVLFILYMVIVLNDGKRKHDIIKNRMNEYSVELRGIIMFSENLNHEVNNALSVINNKARLALEKVNRTCMGKEIINNDFEYIFDACDQIETITKKLQGIKHFKHNSDHRTLYEVIQKSFDFATLGSPNVKTTIDEKLLSYEAKGISNIDLHGRLLNHIKNSIEAKASEIKIVLGKLKGDTIGLYIIDNGNGVPAEVRNTLFDENVSSKKDKNYVGGNGMYINKHIMKAYGGDIRLVSSIPGKTVFELSFKYRKISSKN